MIVVRFTADQPGKISFAAGLKTPMAAAVETDGNDTLVMRGLGGNAGGIKGQLDYQARINIIATCLTSTACIQAATSPCAARQNLRRQ